MSEWWIQKKSKTRKHKKHKEGQYTFWDGLVDVLFWIPEILFIPFRILFWLFRGVWRLFDFS